jgi:hypothetical protein
MCEYCEDCYIDPKKTSLSLLWIIPLWSLVLVPSMLSRWTKNYGYKALVIITICGCLLILPIIALVSISLDPLLWLKKKLIGEGK